MFELQPSFQDYPQSNVEDLRTYIQESYSNSNNKDKLFLGYHLQLATYFKQIGGFDALNGLLTTEPPLPIKAIERVFAMMHLAVQVSRREEQAGMVRNLMAYLSTRIGRLTHAEIKDIEIDTFRQIVDADIGLFRRGVVDEEF
jgi:hypothetical protein